MRAYVVILVMPFGAHGVPMFRLCPKLAFCADPEYVIEARFSAPVALDASAMMVAALCAPRPTDSHATMAVTSIALAASVLAISESPRI
jgi:hypothetical protein